MALGEEWFTEPCEQHGSAFSLKAKKKLHEEQTAYQKIEIFETTQYGNLMTIDGFVMLTDRDNFLYHEMMSHPALYTHPAPNNVLVIGGGDCGTLKEVLKHPEVKLAQQVEIDERVTRLSEIYFPSLCESNNDPRAELHFVDGIKWVKDAAAGHYDVIIVDSTDPIGPAEGLFNEAFYRECHRALGEQGILVQQSESPLYHIKLIHAMREAMQRAGFAQTLTLDFPQPVYPSGWWSATMAGKSGTLTGFRENDAAQKPFATRYYSSARHKASTVEIPLLAEEQD
ncbi:MAG: polyamine aminopropyltransferase [Gammaproteobacteria bacterium]|nr:polyamine aminopropyltransferase [Gammaproteobacteria bacterium]MDH5651913.1 polyamine aminopropyltransferase [Gammaproteobacteria bacterium]